MQSTKPKSNAPKWVAAIVGLAVYTVGTYVVVEVAGGTKIEPSESNTPNGVTQAPPPFKK
jgi:hypothetical protein